MQRMALSLLCILPVALEAKRIQKIEKNNIIVSLKKVKNDEMIYFHKASTFISQSIVPITITIENRSKNPIFFNFDQFDDVHASYDALGNAVKGHWFGQRCAQCLFGVGFVGFVCTRNGLNTMLSALLMITTGVTLLDNYLRKAILELKVAEDIEKITCIKTGRRVRQTFFFNASAIENGLTVKLKDKKNKQMHQFDFQLNM